MSEARSLLVKPIGQGKREAAFFFEHVDVDGLFQSGWFYWLQSRFKRKRFKEYIANMEVEVDEIAPDTACYFELDDHGLIVLDRRLLREQKKNPDLVLRILIHEATHGVSWRYMAKEAKKKAKVADVDPTEALASFSEVVFMKLVLEMGEEAIKATLLRDYRFSTGAKPKPSEEKSIRRSVDQTLTELMSQFWGLWSD